MRGETLFGYLAPRLATQPENLATEALAYVLQQSSTARTTLIGYCRQFGGADDVPGDLQFRTQSHAGDQAIPDLVGIDETGSERLLVESKFWAGLTDHQPVTYLKRLNEHGGALMFFAPGLRLPTLWPELLRRCIDAKLPLDEVHGVGDAVRAKRVGPSTTMMLVDWRSILAALTRALSANLEAQLVEDVGQINGLCERMDTEGFLPLRSEEMTAATPLRMEQFAQLVDELTADMANQKVCDLKGLTVASTAVAYGRYMATPRSRVGVYLARDVRKWHRLAPTPMWIRIHGQKFKPVTQQLRNLLQPLEADGTHRVFPDPDFATALCVPLFPPLGEERDVVVRVLREQLVRVVVLLDQLPAPEAPNEVVAAPDDAAILEPQPASV